MSLFGHNMLSLPEHMTLRSYNEFCTDTRKKKWTWFLINTSLRLDDFWVRVLTLYHISFMYVSLRSAHVVTKLLKASFDLQYFTTIRPGLVIFLREVVLFEIFVVVQLSLIVSESSLTVLGTLFRSSLCGIKHSETSFNWLDHKTWYCYVFVGCTRFCFSLCL